MVANLHGNVSKHIHQFIYVFYDVYISSKIRIWTYFFDNHFFIQLKSILKCSFFSLKWNFMHNFHIFVKSFIYIYFEHLSIYIWIVIKWKSVSICPSWHSNQFFKLLKFYTLFVLISSLLLFDVIIKLWVIVVKRLFELVKFKVHNSCWCLEIKEVVYFFVVVSRL